MQKHLPPSSPYHCTELIKIFVLFRRNIVVYGSLGATLLSLGLFLYLSHLQTSESSQLGRSAPGQAIANSRIIRLAIFLISNTLIATCAVFSVVSIIWRMGSLRTENVTVSKIKSIPNFAHADKFRGNNRFAVIQCK